MPCSYEPGSSEWISGETNNLLATGLTIIWHLPQVPKSRSLVQVPTLHPS
jgi:hypothetical protein